MKLKFAIAGLRHDHIIELHEKINKHPSCELVAVCEEDLDAQKKARENWKIETTHDSFRHMLENVAFDVLAVGDYYSNRGTLVIEALKADKHIIADKPLCTKLSELDEISILAKANNRKIGCMIGLRAAPNACKAKQIILDGSLGEIHAIQFGGQHPLMYGIRPAWYFEEGKHGGTINDIAIHGIDLVEWLTGLKVTELIAARTWNTYPKMHPHFNNAAQFMFALSNKCGVMGDVSYLLPDSFSYKLPFYWRTTIWGDKGVIEFNCIESGVKVALDGMTTIAVESPDTAEIGFLDSFLNDIAGKNESLNTEHILNVSRTALQLQEMANKFTLIT